MGRGPHWLMSMWLAAAVKQLHPLDAVSHHAAFFAWMLIAFLFSLHISMGTSAHILIMSKPTMRPQMTLPIGYHLYCLVAGEIWLLWALQLYRADQSAASCNWHPEQCLEENVTIWQVWHLTCRDFGEGFAARPVWIFIPVCCLQKVLPSFFGSAFPNGKELSILDRWCVQCQHSAHRCCFMP